MFYFKNIGIWYLLLSLVRAIKPSSSLEENKAIPYLSGDVRFQDEAQHLWDHSQNTGDNPNLVEDIPIKHAEEEIKEYDDYRDERDSPNLINGGLGLFSWWKSEKRGKAKARLRTVYPPVTETTCPPVFGTTCPPAVETTCSSDIETNFPLVTEITFPLDIKTIDSPDIETTCPPVIGNAFSSDTETICTPEMETTCPPVIETTCPPVIGNAFSSDNETICTPEMETTCLPVVGNAFSSGTETICTPEMETACTPDVETTCPPFIGNTFFSDTETICTPEMETTCTAFIGNTFFLDNETICTPDTETICTPDTETICTPDTETICTPDTETICTSDTETICTPDTETICTPDTETICTPDTETICTPDTETTFLPYIKTSCPPDMETISNPNTERLCLPDADTTCLPNSPQIIIGDTGTISPDDIGASTSGAVRIWSTIIDSRTIYASTMDSITNGFSNMDSTTNSAGTIGSTKDDSGPIAPSTNGFETNDSTKYNYDTIGSAVTSPGEIGKNTNSPGGIGSKTYGPGGIGSNSNVPGGISSNTNGPGGIGSKTNGPGGIGSDRNGPGGIAYTTNGFETNDSTKYDLDSKSPTVTSHGEIGTKTNSPGGIGSKTYGPGGIGTNTNGPSGIGSKTNGPGGIGSVTNGPGGIGSNTNGPTGIGSVTTGPGGIGSKTYGPGGIGTNTNGPGGIGSKTYGPGGIGTNTNGPGGIGSVTTGPGGIGSKTYGPGGIGSNSNVPGGIGSNTNGPGGIGSNTNGPGGIGTNTKSSGTIGSSTDLTGTTHSTSNGSGTIGSSTSGLSTILASTVGTARISSGASGGSTTKSKDISTTTARVLVKNTVHTTIAGESSNIDNDAAESTTADGYSASEPESDPFTIFGTTEESVDIRITVDPVAISTDGIGSDSKGHGEIGSNTKSPGTIGPSTDLTGIIHSISNVPGTIGSNSNGLSTILFLVGTARISSGASGASTTKSKNISTATARVLVKNTVYSTIAADSSNIHNDAADSTTADGDLASEAESDPFTISDTTEESVDIRITVDPAAISTDPDNPDTGTKPADSRATVDQAGISTGPDSDKDADIVTTITNIATSSGSTSSNSTSTKAYLTACYTITLECSPITIGTPVICDPDDIGIELTDAASEGTTTDRPTTATESTGDSLADVEDEAVSTDANLNDVTTPSNKNFTDFIFGNTTVGIPPPPPLRMLGAGMILPIYQIPLTPVKVSPTGPSIQPKKVPFEGIHYGRDSVWSKLRVKDIYKGQKSNINKPSLLSKWIYKNHKDGVLKTESNHKSINALEKHPGYKLIILKERLAPLKNQREDSIFPNQRPGQLSQYPEKTLHNISNSYPYSVSALLTERPVEVPNVFKKSCNAVSNALPENSIQRGENQALSDMKNYISGFVKYNDTYLSQNSNISVNLVDLCKNVTCQGNNYLSQCCSRVCGPEKCEGEDFSYLHPIPGDTTTVTTTVKVLGPSLGTNATYYTANFKSNVSDCSCNSKKKNSRAAKQNDKKHFIKFQSMDGVTNPYQKEMMGTLKEENIGVQKEHREVLSNGRTNVLRMNSGRHVDNSPITNYQRLSQEGLEGVISPFNSKNVLDDYGDISNGLLQSKQKHIPFQEDRYRLVRSLGLQNQIDRFKENNIILEKLKKDTEMELKRLSLLETKRREEELSFARERENELKELKTIQELIHREFESGVQGEPAKRGILNPPRNSIKHNDLPEKESTYTKLVRNIENYAKNDYIDNFILNRYSSMAGIASNTVSVDKFPELEIKNPAGDSHGNALLVLNIEPGGEIPSEECRKRREVYNDSQNKVLKENIKSVDSSENIPGMLR